MNLIRVLVIMAALGLGGFALGWLAWPAPPKTGEDAQPAEPERDPPSPNPASVVGRFPLTAADQQSDREIPALAVDAKGRVLLAWASRTGDLEATIFLACPAESGASLAPAVPFRKVPLRTFIGVMRGQERTVTTAVLPRLAAGGDGMTLVWAEPAGKDARLRLLVARSENGGRSFADPVPAHGPEAIRPGFTALATGPDGTTATVWMENRHGPQQPFCSVSDPRLERFTPEALVYPGPEDKGICPCCTLEVARTPAGETLVAFRNSVSGARDIYVARSAGRTADHFDAPVVVTKESWKFDGCPHDGPSLALSGGRVHVAWMDAHTGKRRVYLAHSALDTLAFEPCKWAPPTPGEQGHPRLLAVGGALHAVWDESVSDGSALSTATEATGKHQHHHGPSAGGRVVLHAVSTDGGVTFTTPRSLAARPGAFQTHPVLAGDASGTVYVAWNEVTTEGKSVVCVRLTPSQGGRGS
jgi:hypothetical protein